MNQLEKTTMMTMSNNNTNNIPDQIYNKNDAEEEILLPGFRFHPTDEELVGFYLRRKVEKKPLSIEIIKQIDVYKYDPWGLPKVSPVGDKELYFFCIRERKYKNSVRPNRVTGSGFWKATGIDKPIYSSSVASGASHTNNNNKHCVGLKKSLVYYHGSAGKGTKTDWMMHEFRLPPSVVATAATSSTKLNTTIHHLNSKKISSTTSVHDQEAEIWTLCRIFKRTVASYGINNKNKYQPTSHDYPKQIWVNSTVTMNNIISSSTTTHSYTSPQQSLNMESENRSSSSRDQKFNYYNSEEYSTTSVKVNSNNIEQQGIINKTRTGGEVMITNNNQIHSTEGDISCLFSGELMTDRITHQQHQEAPIVLQQSNNISNFTNLNGARSNDIFFLDYGIWDELGSVLGISSDQPLLHGYT